MAEGSEELRSQGKKSQVEKGISPLEHLPSIVPPNLLITEDEKSKRPPFVTEETESLALLVVRASPHGPSLLCPLKQMW